MLTSSLLKSSTAVLMTVLTLAACADSQPRVIQASGSSPDVTVTVGMATQIEMPDQGRVQTIVVGNPNLVTADKDGDVVNLAAKAAGETNLIIRARNGDGDIKLYQYHVTVQDR